MEKTFSLLCYIKINKRILKKTQPIYLRITVNGKRTEIATKKSVEEDRWDSRNGKVKGNKEDARVINNHLDNLKLKLNKLYNKLVDSDIEMTAELLKKMINGTADEKKKTLIDVFTFHNLQLQKQIGKEFSLSTYKRYETTLMHIKEFLKFHYKKDDILLKDLNYSFITNFEFYLKTERACNHNSTLKYIKNVRKIINQAVLNDWLEKDPFIRFKATLKEVKREYLTKEEIVLLEEKEFGVQRLEQVRDVFLFACYTGLAYVDVAKLTPKDISIGLDGEYWIFTERTKTGNSSNVPLLPKAMHLIEKYKDDKLCRIKDQLLPVASNQKINSFLKEIAILCGIKKNLTFHLARHTFATTVTLSNGVPIETVGAMLGHKNLRTTQIYAKVVQEKVSDDMKALKDKLLAEYKVTNIKKISEF